MPRRGAAGKLTGDRGWRGHHPPAPSRTLQDVSLSTVTAGVVAVLVTFTSTAVLIVQAARATGATPEQTGSWLWALCVGGGALTIVLSLATRMPIVVSWSAASLIRRDRRDGPAGPPMQHIPVAIAAAMLAGILLRFGLDTFASVEARPGLVLAMILVFLVARLWAPRYAVLLSLAAGTAIAWADGSMQHVALPDGLTRPVWVTPHVSFAAIVGLALPLVLVSVASQTVPGSRCCAATGTSRPSRACSPRPGLSRR